MKLVFILLLNQLLSTSSSILHEKATVPVVFGASEEEDELLFGGRSLMVNPPRPVEDGLIIRIVGRDSSGNNVSPVLSEDEAYRRAFAATNSAAEQFSACSGGDFTFVPFRHSALERDGIITVHVNDAPYETYSKRTIREAADLKVCEHFGLPNGCSVGTHHKMFIMAAGLVDGHDNGFLSGAVGGDYSIFGDSPRYGVSSFDTEGILHEVARKSNGSKLEALSLFIAFSTQIFQTTSESDMLTTKGMHMEMIRALWEDHTISGVLEMETKDVSTATTFGRCSGSRIG